MFYSTFFIFVELFEVSNSQWQTQNSFFNNDQKFTYSTGSTSYLHAGNFILPSAQETANFITCTTPATSYITLTKIYPSALNYYNYQYSDGYWVSMDLFFQGTWSSHTIQFTIGSFSYLYTYTSPITYPITTGFCDSIPFEVKTLNFTIVLATSTAGQIKFTSSNTNSGLVSLRNIYFSKLQCYPSCNLCTGPKYNECTSCYYGLPTSNICPTCPSNQYYVKSVGCKDICDIFSPLYSNGFCQNYQISTIEYGQLSFPITCTENLKWSLIYDQEHLDTSPTIITVNQYTYGVFKYNSGIYRYFNQLSTSTQATYLIGLRISIVAYNDIPINCGIQFKINNTYFGSIYRNASGIQTHKLKIFQMFTYGSYLTYFSSVRYELITYVDIPKYSFLFSAIGNYTDGTTGWGMSQIQITSGYCSQYCSLCEVSFKCKTCYGGYYFYRDGSCIPSCQSPYQKLNGAYCYDYDDETPYSQYLIQEYINTAADPGQYAQYTLISQTGVNFLKGSDIYYSYQNGFRVFGGPFVWAQAKFQRIHNIISPHHGVTIAFYIIYGPLFPSDGQFIYTIETNAPVSKSNVNFYSSYPDGTKQDKVYERISHNTNTLTITWECFGPNNEPIKAYCGFYNYYIAVHYCQPYCSQCPDQSTCTLWNSTYDANIIKFSQAQCSINQYYDKDSVRCLDCPLSCLTCTSKIDCQTCKSTYTQTKLGCICKMNQYEDSNQCFDCPIECNQCLSSTYCIECLNSNYRQLSNGQCNCMNGYYPIVSNPQCQVCHQFCKTCIGPTSDECLICNDIINIEQVGSTCRCPTGSFYQDALKSCSSCHSSCQVCFRTTIDGCLTCNPTLYRILKGLKCLCEPGYYEISNICTSCPNTEDSSLSQCYKLCNNNQQIWHTITCNSCDIGFQLVSGECQPICGDLQIKGYEQCEDNNSIFNDLCYNCQIQCPDHCLTCDQSTTLPCPDVCGDGFITGIEECEDGNAIQYDGCFNCKYQCQPQCTKCIKGQCYECSTPGWYIDPTVTPWQCKERCGDMQIIGDEQCDDGNLVDTDGCKNCRYFCRIGCSSCNYTTNTCLSCEFPGFAPYFFFCYNVCGDGQVVTDPYGFYSEQCDDGNTNDYDGCSSSCQFQCQASTICLSCISNRCESCATGYSLSNNKICVPICRDSMIVVGEQCDDSLTLPYKGCQNCKTKCQNSCFSCDTTGLGCLSCKSGYNKIDYLCYSICGDKKITEDEQCDDGNLIIGDGCHFCLFSCQDSCLYCIKGVCYDCQEGYELIESKCYSMRKQEQFYIDLCETQDKLIAINQNCDINCISCLDGICGLCSQGNYLFNNECISNHITNVFYVKDNVDLCGDFKIRDNEECEDNNLTPFDGCYQCKFQCDVNCMDCQFGKCQGCALGYFLNTNSQCETKCGDGIVVLFSNEQCDDDIEECIDCQYQCQPNCSKCDLQQCFQCLLGFLPYQSSCIPICGDGIVIDEYEDCDDKNDQPFDGCFECQFQCSQNCQVCQESLCLQCDIDYSLNNNQCSLKKQNDLNSSIIDESQHNDASINSQNPQLLPLDENIICREYECVYSKKPSMQLTYKNQYYALQYVEITFDQEIKFQQEVLKHQKLFNISIYDLDSQNYNITINSIQDISFNLEYAQYQVVIEIFSSLSTKPILLVQLNQEIVNSNNQTLFNLNKSITLQPPKVISKQIRSVSIYGQKSNKAFMIGAISLCVISLVSGESQIVVETLNLLQYQSFLRFINVDYPENLQIYFQAQELLSITSYLSLFQIDDYLNLITRKEKQIDLSGKFQLYNIEADLFTNILPQLIQFLGLITFLFFVKDLYNIFAKLSKYMRSIQYPMTLYSKILLAILYLILYFKNIVKLIIRIRYLQNYDQIIKLIYINSWDLIFRVILQLHYNRIDNLRSILTTFFASFIFCLYLGFLLKSFRLFNNTDDKNVKAKLEIKFITLDICRTMLFHIVLVLFQEQQILQCLLISVCSIIQCFLTYKYKQCSKLDRIIFLIIEGVLTAFSLSLFLYFDIGQIQISYQNKVTLGFIQMNFLILSLAIIFVKQLFLKIQSVMKFINKKQSVKFASSTLFS